MSEQIKDKLINAAINLESWLSKNVGDTEDYPVHIHCDNMADADAVSCLLTELSQACKEFKEDEAKQ